MVAAAAMAPTELQGCSSHIDVVPCMEDWDESFMNEGREWDDPGLEVGCGEHDLGPAPLAMLADTDGAVVGAPGGGGGAGAGTGLWSKNVLEQGAIQAMRKAELEYHAACAHLAQVQARLCGIRDVMDELRGGGGGGQVLAAEDSGTCEREAAPRGEGGAAAEAVAAAEGWRQESKRALEKAAEQLKAVLSGSQEQALLNDHHIELLDRGGQYQVASWLVRKVEEVCAGAGDAPPGCQVPSMELALRDSHAVRFLQDLNYDEVLRIRVVLPGQSALTDASGGAAAGLHLGWPDEYWSRGGFIHELPYDEVLQIRSPMEWELPLLGRGGSPGGSGEAAAGTQAELLRGRQQGPDGRSGSSASRRVPFADEDFFVRPPLVEVKSGAAGPDGDMLPPLESALAGEGGSAGLLSSRPAEPGAEELVLAEESDSTPAAMVSGPRPRHQAASSSTTRALLLALVSICGGLAGGMVVHSELSVLAKDVCAIALVLAFAALSAFAVGVFPRRYRQGPSPGGSGYVRPWGQVLLAVASVAAMLSVSTVLALLVKSLEAAVLLMFEGSKRVAQAAASSSASLLWPPGKAALGLRLLFAGEVALISCSQLLSAAAWGALLMSVSISVTAALLIAISVARGKQPAHES